MIPMLIRLPDIPKEKPVSTIATTEPIITNERRDVPDYKLEMPVVKFNPMHTVADTSLSKLADVLLKRHKDLLKETLVKTDTIKLVLEKAPQFPGGNTAFQYYFFKNQKYPVHALLAGIHGSTIVSFVVNKEGMVQDAKVVSGIDPELDMEAIRLVKSMPQWEPAYYKGKPIACMLVIPVDFAIR
jgi:TonB family protein